MPLIKIFTRTALRPEIIPRLHNRFIKIFDVPESVLKVINVSGVEAHPDPEGVYVDIRAKAKKTRTPAFMQEAMRQTAIAIQEEGLTGINVRTELYEPTLQATFSLPSKI